MRLRTCVQTPKIGRQVVGERSPASLKRSLPEEQLRTVAFFRDSLVPASLAHFNSLVGCHDSHLGQRCTTGLSALGLNSSVMGVGRTSFQNHIRILSRLICYSYWRGSQEVQFSSGLLTTAVALKPVVGVALHGSDTVV